MKNKIITLFFLLITLSASLSVSAKEHKQEFQEYLRIPMGISAEEFVQLCPNVTPTPAELKNPRYEMYFNTEPLIIFEQEISMIQYLFEENKLSQIDIFFKDESPESAKKLLEECFKFYGKGRKIVNSDTPESKFIAYSWDHKKIHTIYGYFYKKNNQTNFLTVTTQDYSKNKK